MTMMRCTHMLLLWALALSILQGCGRSQAAEPRDGPFPELVDLPLEVTRGDFTSRLLLTGELEAKDAAPMVVPNVNIWPLALRWVAKNGAKVAAGEVVAEFDNSQLLSNLEELETQVLAARNQLWSDNTRVASELAEAEFEVEKIRSEVAKARIDAEVSVELLAQRDYDRRQLDLKRAELELDGAERRLEITRAAGRTDVGMKEIALTKAERALRKAESGIRQLTLEASRAGILLIQRNPLAGRPYRPGDSAVPGRTLAQLPALDTLWVAARLFDVDDKHVRVGQEVRVSLDAFPDLVYHGQVNEIDEVADQIDRQSLRRFFDVKIGLDRVDVGLMRPGMSVKIVLEDAAIEDALLIPRAALDWQGTQAAAILAGGERRPVELGPCNAFHCVVQDPAAPITEGTRLQSRLGETFVMENGK